MIVKFLEWLTERLMRFSRKPWVRFTMYGIDDDNQVKVVSAFNKAFIKNVKSFGIYGASEDEIVSNFLLGTIIIPKQIWEEETNYVAPSQHPNLSSETNRLKVG